MQSEYAGSFLATRRTTSGSLRAISNERKALPMHYVPLITRASAAVSLLER